MPDAQPYTEQQLVQIAKEHFGACLIISAASFFLFGYTVSQFVNYISKFWRRDKRLTRSWVVWVMGLNTASVLYGGVYADWLLSITSWQTGYAHANDVANGVSSILYGLTVSSVQLFWVGCIFRMMASRTKLGFCCCVLIALVSLASLAIAIALGAILIHQTRNGVSSVHYLIILVVIFANMLAIKKSSKTLKRSISRLTFIFAVVTCISSLLLVLEIVIIYPSGTQSRYIIDFTYFYAPTYTFSMFAILNARHSLFAGNHLQVHTSTSKDKDIEKLEPQMHFTIDKEANTAAHANEKEGGFVSKDYEGKTEPVRFQVQTVQELLDSSQGGIETSP